MPGDYVSPGDVVQSSTSTIGQEERSKPMNPVFYVVLVVLFWAALFVFAFVITVRFLRIPTDAELELAAEEKEDKTHSGHH
jgi:hypothetical protein